MRVRTRLAGLLVTASMVVAGLVLLAAAGGAAAATSSPAPAEKAPLVNWTWLGFGLGGVVILLVVMLLLTRVFGGRSREEK
jgi:hypothetical protein